MRITPEMLGCVVFICRERLIDRQTKIVPVATGFLVRFKVSEGAFVHYIVTARHAIEADVVRPVIIRANTKGGGSRCIVTDASEWLRHDNADLALIPFGPENDLDIRSIPFPENFINPDYTFAAEFRTDGKLVETVPLNVRTGDEVAAIGLFIEDCSDSANLPIASLAMSRACRAR